MSGLQGKRVLVTGAAGGLGTALTRTLVEAGAEVLGVVKAEADSRRILEAAPGGQARAIVADLARASSLTERLEAEIAAHGPVFGIVNNAAIYPKARLDALDMGEVISVLSVNAVAAAAVVQACLPGMKELGQGRIVNVTSITFDTGMEELGAYVASKGALIGLTRVWARELGPHSVTVNAVAPGAFRTDAEKIHPDPEEYSRFVMSRQALKRRGEPKEFADLVSFLLSERAAFITGQTIRIDGGWVTH
ncbi:SDR family NAD(P)-dependent oxidoreductase [Sinorhizobium meliloti]|uniref:SDR family NAD(P)-dependent oxidoreductase n=1 Tax=Rhizobium meliloti TaxID=382 RepID=UPI000FDADEBD|nr:SDR family NAD(P)-dependent oxidoreductase [Sinorhizobium meliloti]RVG72696.1 SDR family oxidoreductase [Sinorhizobium meliloti]RVH47626.1 SDR family oxidoreductase [Sinorhizobium meliloti]RVO70180.1 SDR family oxidoreductase [Sinorhizobium meliloti]